ncbi:MAG: hypothetical protein K2J00_02285 [Bacteroidaceae bacterium]|nr:hypothetical protein [Bacteroidaceae bacterium]
MKKIFIIAIFMATAAGSAQAQEIFDYLLDKNELVINDAESSDFDLKVAQFKFTAMRYFRKNIIQQEGSISSAWLDEQALALNEFVTNYLMELSQNSNADEKTRKAIVLRYCRASWNHAMFKKADKKEAEAFVRDKGGYTPFSLNTNWVEALAETKKN